MREILERQRVEVKEILSKEIIPRENIKNIEEYIDKPLIKVITGIRRSGKSLLALLLLKDKNYGYANFDEKELTTIRLDDLLNYLKEVFGDFKFLLLDEIQNVNGWELWVNSLQRRGYNILITGSNAKLLSKELATHLTGRYIEIENFPFSFREFLIFKKFDTNNLLFLKEKQGLVKKLLMEYLEKGGFPEYLVYNLDKNYLETLFQSIIYKDVVKRWNIKYPRKIDDLARYIISNYSSRYTFTKLKNSLDFRSVLTVENYIKYLEEAYLIFSLERFSFKVKEMKKSPKKVYCIDTGMINAISVKFSKDIGRLMENLVFLELKRKGLKENLSIFYGQFNNSEVDFLIKEGLEIKQLIQVTYASNKDEIEKREIKALLKASELLKCKDLLIITWDYEDEIKINSKKIKYIPLWKWLLEKMF
ncbi:MAG: ATP-binding protein [Candidatus Aenigmatarchaeota archaeon]